MYFKKSPVNPTFPTKLSSSLYSKVVLFLNVKAKLTRPFKITWNIYKMSSTYIYIWQLHNTDCSLKIPFEVFSPQILNFLGFFFPDKCTDVISVKKQITKSQLRNTDLSLYKD